MAFISNGTTILDNGAFSVNLGSMVLLQTQTVSSAVSQVEFTSNIDSTYPIYKFEFINMHPATDGRDFMFNLSTDGGSNYNVTKTSTHFYAAHTEDDTSGARLEYQASEDLAQSTADQSLVRDTGADNDQSCSGSMFLFNPSSTTFVKHFIASVNNYVNDWGSVTDGSLMYFTAGYGNTTSAIDAAVFRFQSSANTESGTIKLYGIKDS
jgi:hypothetical protein